MMNPCHHLEANKIAFIPVQTMVTVRRTLRLRGICSHSSDQWAQRSICGYSATFHSCVRRSHLSMLIFSHWMIAHSRRTIETAIARVSQWNPFRSADQPAALQSPPFGVVHLVSAGCGGVEGMTLEALRLVQQADVILFDDLAEDTILAHAAPDFLCRKIYVGKRGQQCESTLPMQEDIVLKLIDYARRGKCVVRLKAGDALWFGRVADEMEALRRAKIQFYVHPGVSSMNGAAASIEFPITARNVSESVLVLSGHKPLPAETLQAAKYCDTLVLFMATRYICEISHQLMQEAGKDGSVPVVAVQWATRRNKQRIIWSSLEELELYYRGHIEHPICNMSPAIIYVGCALELAKLQERDKQR